VARLDRARFRRSNSGKPIGRIRAFEWGGAAVWCVGLLVFAWIERANSFMLQVAALIAFWACISIAWNVLFRFVGLFTFANGLYFAFGAYSAAISLGRWGTNPIVAGLVGMCLSVAGALLMALFVARSKGRVWHFALVSVFFVTVLEIVVSNGGNFTGGSAGLLLSAGSRGGWAYFRYSSPGGYVVIFVCLALASMLLVAWLKAHPIGYRWLAIREDQEAAQSVGIPVVRYQTYGLIVSAVLTSVCGTFYWVFEGFIDPDTALGSNTSVEIIVRALLGGSAFVLGPLIGSTVVTAVEVWFDGSFGSNFGLDAVLYAVFLIAVGHFLVRTGRLKGLTHSTQLAGWLQRLIPLRPQAPTETEHQPEGSPDGVGQRRLAQEERANNHPPDSSDGPVTAYAKTEGAGRPLLECRNIRVSFGAVVALDDLSLSLSAGRIYGLVGPNGSGKSTLIGAIARSVVVSGGSVLLDGIPLDKKAAWQRARLGIARTFQTPRPFGELSVLENVYIGALGKRRPQTGGGRRAAEDAARNALAWSGLESWAETKARQLGPSNLRRLEVARAMTMGPRVLLLDEMLAGLTDAERTEFISKLRVLRDSGVLIIMVEHSPATIAAAADEVFVLDRGHVLAQGIPDQVFRNEDVIAAYLGSS
jgi:branched-chain amino acid transport system permease protein